MNDLVVTRADWHENAFYIDRDAINIGVYWMNKIGKWDFDPFAKKNLSKEEQEWVISQAIEWLESRGKSFQRIRDEFK
jgi:hypothetical protein